MAQDDELPPPTSSPTPQNEQPAPGGNDNFNGFATKKKVDLSKFIIEPNVNFSITSGRIDFGFSPYVGYKVWEPAYAKRTRGNVGLFLGGGITYFYTGFKNIGFQDYSGNTYYANAHWHTLGGGVFAQYNIWRGFFARAKFEVLHRRLDDFYGNVDVQLNTQNGTYKVIIPRIEKTIPALLVGVGYNLLQSKNFFFPIMVSYNVLNNISDKNYSIYPRGLVVQLGFINIF